MHQRLCSLAALLLLSLAACTSSPSQPTGSVQFAASTQQSLSASDITRVKVTVTILGTDLRADALRVAMARQTNTNGQWLDAPVQAATVQKLEDIILTRARDLRRTTVGG